MFTIQLACQFSRKRARVPGAVAEQQPVWPYGQLERSIGSEYVRAVARCQRIVRIEVPRIGRSAAGEAKVFAPGVGHLKTNAL